MSGDLISKSELIAYIRKYVITLNRVAEDSKNVIIKVIDKQPTIEAVPVVCGEWKEYEEFGSRGYHYCSKCYYPAFKRDFCRRSIESLSNFCPNCGAKMKGGAE